MLLNEEEIINEIYKATIPKLIEKIENESKKEDVILFLEKIIKVSYKKQIKQIENENNQELLKKCEQQILKEFNYLRETTTHTDEVVDENYSKLIEYSNKSFELAKERCETNKIFTDTKMYDEYLSNLQVSSEKVLEKNKEKAKLLLSEGLVDLDYAYGYINAKSFRLAAYT